MDTQPPPLHPTHTQPPPREIEIRSEASGATGGKVWHAAGVLADVLKERTTAGAAPQTILELGSGTGYLAMRLAAAGVRGTRVIATDVPERMRSIGFNVSRNGLRHAIRCVPWDWSDHEPPALDWQSITQCVASEVIYYDETCCGAVEAALANALATVLERCCAGVEVLLMLRVRVMQEAQEGEAAGGGGAPSRMHWLPSDSYDARSPVFAFVERALPRVGLRAALLPLGERAAGSGSGCGLRLYAIHKAVAFACLHTAPVREVCAPQRRPAPVESRPRLAAALPTATVPRWLQAPAVQEALARELQTAWLRQRLIAGRAADEEPPPADEAPPAEAPPAAVDSQRSWRYEVEVCALPRALLALTARPPKAG